MWGIELAVMAAMIGVNSLFAGYEIALASVQVSRLQRLVDENRRGAKVALFMKQNMEASLAVVQLGITLVGAVAAAVGGAGADESIAPVLMARFGASEGTAEFLAIAIVVIPLTVVTIMVGELIPKVYALRNAERVCLTFSPFMRWFSLSVWPAVWFFETVVRGVMSWGERRARPSDASQSEASQLQDLRAAVGLVRASRLIGQREERIILRATELQSRPVREIMLPAEHVNMLHADAGLSDSLIAAHLDMHTRFPVVERPGDPQTIIGYVNVKDITAVMRMSPVKPSLRAIVRPLPTFREEETLSSCLEQMIRDHTHMALVRDARGLVVGMITMEDVLEELVGEIHDEYDRLPSHVTGAGGFWIVGGGTPIERIAAATGIELTSDGPGSEGSSLSGWVEGRLGREARGGDVVEQGPIRVAVRKLRRKKVLEALVSRSD
ncbi:MAG TPA: hemolysin family protein [Candidatus Eisenbacteria bacterium]|nr:hemolysin family protein [Candidatus Eisenbacteria bacterium]